MRSTSLRESWRRSPSLFASETRTRPTSSRRLVVTAVVRTKYEIMEQVSCWSCRGELDLFLLLCFFPPSLPVPPYESDGTGTRPTGSRKLVVGGVRTESTLGDRSQSTSSRPCGSRHDMLCKIRVIKRFRLAQHVRKWRVMQISPGKHDVQ